MENIQYVTLAGPSQVPHNALFGADTPHQLRCPKYGVNYEDTQAWEAYEYARKNWLTVSRYVAIDKGVKIDNGVATFEDGSQLVFAK